MITLPNGIGMAQIGPSKHTRPERRVRMWFVRNGLCHELHPRLPGLPRRSADFRVQDVLVFVHGRFWHDPRAGTRSMSPYWREKVKRNAQRDRDTRRHLDSVGARYVVLWEDDELSEVLPARLWPLLSKPSASSAAGRSSRTRTAPRALGSRSRPENFAGA